MTAPTDAQLRKLAAGLSLEDRAALKAAAEEDLRRRQWSEGDLSWKLDSTQMRIRAARNAAWMPAAPLTQAQLEALPVAERVRRANVPISFFECCSRGTGKSYELLCLIVETALKTPNARVLYCGPLRDDATVVAKDLLSLFILTDCPDTLAPEWKAGDGEFWFKNGSILRLRGVNNESKDRLRGPGYHLVVMDECGTMDDLKSVLGIVEPIASRLGGKVVLATTPAETPGHESKEVFDEHVLRGAAVTFTLNDNVRLTWDQKAAALMEGIGGEDPADVPGILAGTIRAKKTKTRRERYCDWIVEGESAVHPTWTDLEPELTVQIEH